MLKIKNLTITTDGRTILESIELVIKEGEVVYVTGKNGAGKSSLAKAISGNYDFEVEGEILLTAKNQVVDLLKERTDSISRLGVFLAYQNPVEIPGVNIKSFLRLIYNKHHSKQLNPFKFNNLLKDKASEINFPLELLERNLNEGFSGGEKKKLEALQLLLIEPKIVILDELDSGMDKSSMDYIFKNLRTYKENNSKTIFLVITHYEKVYDYLKPDKIYEVEGKALKELVQS